MQYLLDIQWADPVAKAVRQVLTALPHGVQSMTASVPLATIHGFTVLRAENGAAIEKIAHGIVDARADVRIVAADGG